MLKLFGTNGNGATPNKLADFFLIDTGTVLLYVQRTVEALVSIRSNVRVWPNEDKRRVLASRIRAKWVFLSCVGFIDGILSPLGFKSALCGEDYFSHKVNYAVSCLVVCADKSECWLGGISPRQQSMGEF